MNSTNDFKIIGSGKITIGDKIIPFENKVNSNFLVAPNFMLDMYGTTKQSSSAYTGDYSKTVKFSLLEELVDSTMTKAYTEMASIDIASFTIIQATLLKSTVRASGNINKSGTIRSAGFNVATRKPSSNTISQLNLPYRRITLTLTGSTTVTRTSGWVYNNSSKALYNYTTATIYKIPFDIDTGSIGSEQIISTNWIAEGSRFSFTDGRNRVFRQNSGTSMKIFDMSDDTIKDVTFSQEVDDHSENICWDETQGNIRCFTSWYVNDSLTVEGYTIDLDGNVTRNTGSMKNWDYQLIAIKNTHCIENGSFIDFVDITSPEIAEFKINMLDKDEYIKDSNKNIVTVSFPSITPSTMILNLMREPDSSQTILSIPETSVQIGESFGIEYTFTVIDGR